MDIFAMSTWHLAGLAGVTLYLGSYAALQTGFLRGSGYQYAFLNLVAATLVLVSLVQDFNLSSAIIQVLWIVISTIGILRLWYIRHAIRFSDREAALVTLKLNHLSPELGCKLLKAGRWQRLGAGHRLASKNHPVKTFYFLLKGVANVSAGGKIFALIGENEFIGEVMAFTSGPATADVTAQTDMEVFAIDTNRLREVAPVGSTLRQSLELAIADDLRIKLANRTKCRITGRDSANDMHPETALLLKDLDLLTAA